MTREDRDTSFPLPLVSWHVFRGVHNVHNVHSVHPVRGTHLASRLIPCLPALPFINLSLHILAAQPLLHALQALFTSSRGEAALHCGARPAVFRLRRLSIIRCTSFRQSRYFLPAVSAANGLFTCSERSERSSYTPFQFAVTPASHHAAVFFANNEANGPNGANEQGAENGLMTRDFGAALPVISRLRL